MKRHRTIYANGAAYRPARGLYAGPASATMPAPPFLSLHQHRTWPSLWESVRTRLRQHGFQDSTLRLYRQVLRAFRSHLATHSPSVSGFRFQVSSFSLPFPSAISTHNISSFIDSLVARQTSASWLSTNIAVLRTVFDKLANHNWTRAIPTPKFPFHLPCILSANEVSRLIEATPSLRDRLFIGFLHGCGMRTGEVARLRWRDLDLETRAVTVRHPHIYESRYVSVPDSILPILIRGKSACKPDDFIFPGAKEGKTIAERTIERAIRRSARAADLTKPVNCMTLRHSYAIARLKAGASICEVQQALGHKRIATTLRYQDMLIATKVKSPVDHKATVPVGDSARNIRAAFDTLQQSLDYHGISNAGIPACVSRNCPIATAQSNGISMETPINNTTTLAAPAAVAIDYNLDPDLAVFPFAGIPFDFRTVFRSIRSFFRFG